MLIDVRSREADKAASPSERLQADADLGNLRKPMMALGVMMAVTGYLRTFLWADSASAAVRKPDPAKPEDMPGTAKAETMAANTTEAPSALEDETLTEAEPGPNSAAPPGGGGGAAIGDVSLFQPSPIEPGALPPEVDIPTDVGHAPAIEAATQAAAASQAAANEAGASDASGGGANEEDDEDRLAELEGPVAGDADEESASAAAPGDVARFLGTDGADRISATELADEIIGLGGDDMIIGLGGDDLIDAGSGNDRIAAGTGNDIVMAGSGDDVVVAAEGDDVVLAGAGDDRVWGGDGADMLVGEAGADLIDAGAGDDFVSGGAGNDLLLGGLGADDISGGAGADSIEGGDGNDRIDAGAGADTVQGGSGIDLILAAAGDDLVYGEEGEDVIFGGAGNDTISGGDGNDQIEAGPGADVVFADGGDDLVKAIADLSDDVFVGGDGVDTLDYSSVSSDLTVDFATARVSGDETGTDSFAEFETVETGQGDDTLIFDETPVTVTGGDGDDCFDFSALPETSADPEQCRYTITDFEVGDHLRFGQSHYYRDFDFDARDDDREDDDAPFEGYRKYFGRKEEEEFEEDGVRVTFVNRTEADRIESYIRLDLDGDGRWDRTIDVLHADADDLRDEFQDAFAA